jgi:phosphoribosylformimino-5-aminoimidazole carboxamide ribotide isomerase
VLTRYHDGESTARAFELLPAIDLLGGRVVRLERGDFARETAFSEDPVATALAFADAGARWLHVVDLDAARDGSSEHGGVIGRIVEAVGERVAVELAGGLRTERAVGDALRRGAARAVVGTAALREPAFAARLVERHGSERIAVALDVRAGDAVGHGWVPGARGVDAVQALLALADAGVQTFEVTAIERDGMLAGPDLELYRRLVAVGRGSIIASAGVASTDDLRALRELGCSGAIVGRALYDGRLTLEAALRAFE